MEAHPTRLLVALDEGAGALGAVRALRAAGYAPLVAVSRDDTYAARSRAAEGVVRVPDPHVAPDAFARALAAAAAERGAAAVLPGTEASYWALTGRESLFDGVPVATCAADVHERATSKRALAELAPQAGLETPRGIELTSDEAAARAGELDYPVAFKPLASVWTATNGAVQTTKGQRADDPESLRRLVASFPPGRWLVQEYVAGHLAAVAGVAWEGRTICTSHQVADRIWPPGRGTSAYARTVAPDASLDAGVRRLVELIGWSGIFQAQFIRNGDPKLIDFNPRIYGSIALAVAGGLNLPAIWADLVLGREPRVGTPRAGVRYRVEEDDLRALWRELREGRRREAILALLPRRDTAHAVFSLRDPAPMLATVRKALPRRG